MRSKRSKSAAPASPQSTAFSAARAAKAASAEDWLSAMDGVAYLVAPDGTIIGVGREGWAQFIRETGGKDRAGPSVIGRSLFAMIADGEAKLTFVAIHARIASLAQRALSYEYRCDAPDRERLMKMSLSALTAGGRLLGVLYQSTLLTSKDRVPLEFLEDPEATREQRRQSALPFVKICQFCADVTMQAWGAEWVKPSDYYLRGGPPAVRLSHGVCPKCDEGPLGAHLEE